MYYNTLPNVSGECSLRTLLFYEFQVKWNNSVSSAVQIEKYLHTLVGVLNNENIYTISVYTSYITKQRHSSSRANFIWVLDLRESIDHVSSFAQLLQHVYSLRLRSDLTKYARFMQAQCLKGMLFLFPEYVDRALLHNCSRCCCFLYLSVHDKRKCGFFLVFLDRFRINCAVHRHRETQFSSLSFLMFCSFLFVIFVGVTWRLDSTIFMTIVLAI